MEGSHFLCKGYRSCVWAASQLWWDVPVIDSFELLRDIYSISQAMYKNNLEELTELLNLSELLKTPARQLSLGQKNAL